MAPFHGLVSELAWWRTSPEMHLAEGESDTGNVLGFVRGLRFSVRLIYALRGILSHTNLEVDWGHLLDHQNHSFSPECDVIIHRRGHEGRWNGHAYGEQVMDFRFIRCGAVVAVISCKSKLTSKSSLDAAYCTKVKAYVDTVFLFAECCEDVSVEALRQRATAAGYDGFWALYGLDSGTLQDTPDEPGWEDFVQRLYALTQPPNKEPAH